MWAYLWVFWGHTTLWNTPLEIFSLKYVLMWVREQKRAFILDFWVICKFSPMSGLLLPFWSNIPLQHPQQPKKYCGILLWRYFPKNISWFGYGNKIEPSYWTFEWNAIFSLWVVIFCHFGHSYPFHTLETPNILCEILLWRYFLKNILWCGYGNEIEPSYWNFEWFAIFFLWVVILCLFGHTYPFHTPDTPNILCGIVLWRYFPQNIFWSGYGN